VEVEGVEVLSFLSGMGEASNINSVLVYNFVYDVTQSRLLRQRREHRHSKWCLQRTETL
jgi:hypothetical protein